VDGNGTFFGTSYRDVDLETGEKERDELISQGVEIPVEWDDVRLFFVSHPEYSAYRCSAICRKDWRKFYQHMKDGDWQADRAKYEAQVDRETIKRLAMKMAGKRVKGFEKYFDKLEAAAAQVIDRAMKDLGSDGPEPYETIASMKDEQGGIRQVKQRLRRPSGFLQDAILERYEGKFALLMGLQMGKSGAQMMASAEAKKAAEAAAADNDGEIDKARRSWDAQNALWATELGQDYDPDAPNAVGKRTAADAKKDE